MSEIAFNSDPLYYLCDTKSFKFITRVHIYPKCYGLGGPGWLVSMLTGEKIYKEDSKGFFGGGWWTTLLHNIKYP